MSWLLSLFIALLTGVLGLCSAGFVAAAYAKWHRVSNFEGASGYLIVLIAFLGGVAGFAIGLGSARLVAAGAAPGFWKALGWSAGIVLGIASLATLLAWWQADLPPKIEGQELDLEVEVRLPVGVANSPASDDEESYLRLTSSADRGRGDATRGALRFAGARREGGRWMVPGRVSLFTTRGRRLLDIYLHGKLVEGFVVPLPSRPGHEHEQWSDWGPRPLPPDPPWPDTKVSYRFRVRRQEPPSSAPAGEPETPTASPQVRP